VSRHPLYRVTHWWTDSAGEVWEFSTLFRSLYDARRRGARPLAWQSGWRIERQTGIREWTELPTG
jgi:hypothetical protein